MNTRYRLFSALVIVSMLLTFVPVGAVDTDCDKIPDWYLTLDTKKVLVSSFNQAFGGKTAKERQKSKELFSDTVISLIDFDTPKCLVTPYWGYVEGLLTLSVALDEYFAGHINNFTLKFAAGMQRVGEFRGFLKAIGVEVEYSADVSLYFR